MIRAWVALAAVIGSGGGAQAQGLDLPFAPEVVLQCLDGPFPDRCVGMIASACELRDGPGSTGLCRGLETAFWQGMVTDRIAALTATDQRAQDNARRLGLAPVPSLAQVQATHTAATQALCDFETAAWEGMHTGPVTQACLMRQTAALAIWLRGVDDAD